MLTAPTAATIPTGKTCSRGWAAAAAVAAVAVAVAPFLVWHLRWMSVRAHYEAFPLVVLGAAVLAWVRFRHPLTCASEGPAAPRMMWAGLLVGWVGVVAAEVLSSSWLACVSVMILVPPLAYGLGGREVFRRVLPAWGLLWLLVPPPMDFDRLLILQLQGLTTVWSGAVLDALEVFHLAAGNVIEIDGRSLLVEQACSGINSLFSLLACTLFLVLLTRRGWGRGTLLMLAAVGWVLVANVTRVVLVAMLETRWGVTAATGWRHEAIGVSLFTVAVGLLLSTDRLLEFLTRPSARAAESPRPVPAAATVQMPVPPKQAVRVAAVVVPSFLVIAGLHWAARGNESIAPVTVPSELASSPELLPAKVGEWERRDFGTETREAHNFFGEHSQNWLYSRPEMAVKSSLAYPFPGWHDLTWCYRSTGWQIDSQEVRTPANVPGGFVQVRLSKPGFRHGFLVFCEFDRSGRPFLARPGGAREPLFRHEASFDRIQRRLEGRPLPPPEPTGAAYQFQVFVEGASPLAAEGEEDVRQLFVALQSHLRERWAAEGGAKQ
ncbi:Transmembrane exosortase (Exosortase_EpsH) [Gemmata obscuriglobus]|nr:exosortase U [Gemmata obscuriglobus]QEG27279.1 Transmembrane exosortase (Exosortase_EpsH) [Gemmata obscuriglobus]VTS04073.1 Eight transmembrane protein EpsH OS=Planctomyces brasiliensis (strain ATCC 49424 / DSM 5305 / JCM 21570 / NBRC 103401 / IFAM 1448) GN=Plabr_4192 PE=4 SV=1: Exosortase_EpsH [Gemmata obscuriglobus UQM 2246]